MEQKAFIEKLNTIKNDIIDTINTKVKAALDGKEDTKYIELNKKVYNDCITYYTYIKRLDIIDGKITLTDYNYECYDIDDSRISVWALASIADQLNNNQYKLDDF